MKKTLGILGGMGPLATSKLFDKILLLTDASSDQEHLDIIIYNKSTIPDRTKFIKGTGEDPTHKLIYVSKQLELAGAGYLVMPCNTAHFFYNEIIKHIKIPFISMIEETVNYITKEYPQENQIGILATEGTIITKIYDKAFANSSIKLIKPSYEDQKVVSKLIYDIKKGHGDLNIKRFIEIIKKMKNNGVTLFILGCTELSVAHEMFNINVSCVDPLEVIAVKSIEYAGKKVKYEFLKTLKNRI